MNNPFEKRASEYFRDDESFLAVVSPEPVTTYLKRYTDSDRLYDRLVLMRGAPGSGKTTIAQLFEYHRIAALLRHRGIPAYQPLMTALAECGAIADDVPSLVGCRIAMESGYRDVWEFPYDEDLRTGLLTSLIQARAVLGWLRNLEKGEVRPDQVTVVPRSPDTAALRAIGGTSGLSVLERAKEVEYELYQVAAALIPPDVRKLESGKIGAYHPFDVIEALEVQSNSSVSAGRVLRLHPLVIMDDAQTLHSAQFSRLEAWLTRRELRVGRWVLSWLDVVAPKEALSAGREDDVDRPEQPGIDPDRVVTRIYLQSGYTDRKKERRAFRKTAKDMASRYLQQMPLFANRGLQRFENLLLEGVEVASKPVLAKLRARIERECIALGISHQRFEALEGEVDRYLASSKSNDLTPDLRLAMVRILMHRYVNRIPQADLFREGRDLEPVRPVVANSGVAEGARVHLLHEQDRPYYYGMDTLCDAGTENAEQFLRLAAALVERASTQLTRAKPATLTAATQHEELRRRATKMLNAWSFPNHESVRRLIDGMAKRCVHESLTENAWLNAGANAFGIRQGEFDRVHHTHPELARTLQLGVAYNALALVPDYPCKGDRWNLIELGGVPILNYGLTFKRGGFVTSTPRELERLMAVERAPDDGALASRQG